MVQKEKLKGKNAECTKLFGEGLKFEKVHYDISKIIGTLELPDCVNMKNIDIGNECYSAKRY